MSRLVLDGETEFWKGTGLGREGGDGSITDLRNSVECSVGTLTGTG